MSLKKGGFSTLNRWLGIKNKDKNTPNGKLSKSSTNLSVSTTDMSEPSQLEYNRITPVPAATSNAPFEQTFRITVLLPKDQLYVARLGARVSLNKLLELVCEHKQLDAQKYEFRNPVDPSQVYSTELTIGAVGLSEVRLCHKSESYDNFNADEVIKLHRTSVIRDSLSSSEFSRHSKHTTKTASPYSSSNSLNSMDSTGVNYTRTPISPPPPALPSSTPPKMMAPPRKKRTAPRPPSQVVIPEKSALVLDLTNAKNGNESGITPTTPDVRSMPRCYVSTPNLSLPTTQISDIDCNGNMNGMPRTTNNAEIVNGHHDNDIVDSKVDEKNERNLYGGSVQNLSSPIAQQAQKFPEPSPRKRLLHIKKKSAPAPPPGGMNGSIYSEDSISLASNTSAPGTPQTPMSEHRSAPRPLTLELERVSAPMPMATPTSPPAHPLPMQATTTSAAISVTKVNTPESEAHVKPMPRVELKAAQQEPQKPMPAPIENQTISTTVAQPPKPVPRLTTTTLLNASNITTTASPVPATVTTTAPATPPPTNNVSKVLLNRTPTPEPRSLSTEPPMDLVLDSSLSTTHDVQLNDELTHDHDNDDNISKQADSGIGEPVPSPLPDSLPSEGSTHESKSTFESSSDDDDMIKVYNFKLGKTVVQPLRDAKTLEDLTTIAAAASSDSDEHMSETPVSVDGSATPVANSETTSWNFAIPISPPPNFADIKKTSSNEEQSDAPITPKILERPVLTFDAITVESVTNSQPSSIDEQKLKPAPLPNSVHMREATATPLPSPTTPLNEILDELNTIISEKRIDTIIKRPDEQSDIEAAKPNTLTNFTITTITQQQQQTTKPLNTPHDIDGTSELVVVAPPNATAYNDGIGDAVANNTTTKPITRSDSFHDTITTSVATATTNTNTNANATTSITTTTTTTTTTHIQQASTTIQTPDINSSNGMTSRSSSYLSLSKIEQNGLNLSRRRSSSDLSIGESPTLQSPEVIKTILNSRKNSLANSSDGESRAAIAEVINRIATLDDTNDNYNNNNNYSSNNHTHTQNNNANMEKSTVASTVATKTPSAATARTQAFIEHEKQIEEREKQQPQELPKVYRYSGPPSINFSTWSERPKMQVSIKNEGDYIFGGKNATNANTAAAVTTATIEINANTNSMPRNFRASTPAEAFWNEHNKLKQQQQQHQPPAVPPKPDSSTIQRMGIPEKEYHVPIVVKPLKDEIVEPPPNVVVEAKRPAMEMTKTKTSITTVTLNGSGVGGSGGGGAGNAISNSSTETTTVMRRTVTQGVYGNATLPRATSAHTNRYSTPAPIVTLRTTAVPLHETSKPKSTNATIADAASTQTSSAATTAAAPFGQNTLRKTGLKEKILAKEEAAKQQQQTKTGVSSVILNSTISNSSSNNSNSHTSSSSSGGSGSTATTNSNGATTTTFVNKPSPQVKENGVSKSIVTINNTIGAPAAATSKPTITIKTTTTAKPFVPVKTPTPMATALQSAKLEMKLQNQNNIKMVTSTPTINNNTKPPTPPTATNTSTISFLKPATNHHTVKQMTTTTTTIGTATTTTPPPPPPPMAPAMTVNVVKKNSVKTKSTTPTSPIDTRDQLLAAIRNFKRDELHRV